MSNAKSVSVISKTKFGLLRWRPRLVSFQTKFETESNTVIFRVSVSRPRLDFSKSQIDGTFSVSKIVKFLKDLWLNVKAYLYLSYLKTV